MFRQIFPKHGRPVQSDAAILRAPHYVPRAEDDCRRCSLHQVRRSAVDESPYDRPCVDLMMSIIEGQAL